MKRLKLFSLLMVMLCNTMLFAQLQSPNPQNRLPVNTQKLIEEKNKEATTKGDVFTATLIKEGKTDYQKCVKILSPSNGSNQNINQNIKIELSNEGLKQADVDVKIYKISNDKNYWNKPENIKELMNTDNTVFLSGRFEKESATTGFKPISVTAKQNGSVLESTLDKGKLSEGAYKMVVISNCGVTSSNFSMGASCGTNDAVVSISCKNWVDGKPTYNISVVFNNVSSSTQSCTTNMNSVSSSTGSITSVATLPTTIPVNGNSPTVNFTYTPTTMGATNADLFFMGIWNDGNSNTSNFHKIIKLPNCICDYCDKVLEFDNNNSPNPTYTATNNSISIHQDWWNMNSAAGTVVGAKAEIISFEREVSDECMKCDKNAEQWGNFISGRSGTSNGSFGNATGTVTGNTHHTLYFANPNSYSFDLNISLPPLSTLACCCEKIKFSVRYTYTFKDKNGECKMCSTVFEYYYQRGSCPIKNPDIPMDHIETGVIINNAN